MSLKTMIKHTAGGRKPRPDVNPHHYHRNNRSPPSMSPPGSMFTRSRTPATGLKTGRSTARCVAACHLNTLPGYVPACSRPKPPQGRKAPRGCLEHAAEAIQRPAGAGHPGVRQGTPAGGTALFFPEELSTTPLRPEPRRNPSKFQKGLVYPGNQAWKCKQPVTSRLSPRLTPSVRGHGQGAGQARLYQNQGRFRFPCGEDYGLVCFVDSDREIGEVTERSIEIPRASNT